MASHVRVPLPHWVEGRLQYVGCSKCAWRYPIDSAEAQNPPRSTAVLAGDAYDAHTCAEHQRAS